MSTRFYGANAGAMLPVDVTEASSTTSSAVELQVDLSKVAERLPVLQCLEALINYIRVNENDPIS